MNISELFDMISAYPETILNVPHRDRQLAAHFASFRENGHADAFYLLSDTGSIITLSAEDLKVTGHDPSPEAWQLFRGKDLERYTPFRIISFGHFAPGSGLKESFSLMKKNAKERITAAEQIQREKPRREQDPVRPAYTDDDAFCFFTKNGIEFRIMSARDFSRYNESRRFFRRSYLPYPDGEARSSAAFYIAAAGAGQIIRLGTNLETAMKAAFSEMTGYTGLSDHVQLIRLKDEYTL